MTQEIFKLEHRILLDFLDIFRFTLLKSSDIAEVQRTLNNFQLLDYLFVFRL